jgi:hypothetical protein
MLSMGWAAAGAAAAAAAACGPSPTALLGPGLVPDGARLLAIPARDPPQKEAIQLQHVTESIQHFTSSVWLKQLLVLAMLICWLGWHCSLCCTMAASAAWLALTSPPPTLALKSPAVMAWPGGGYAVQDKLQLGVSCADVVVV